MKIMCFVLYVALITFFLSPGEVVAEFLCSSQVHYKWAKTAVSKSEDQATPAASPAPEPSIVNFALVERKGADEPAAKEALEKELARVKVRASEACSRDHEGFGGCVGTKFSANKAILATLDFSARKELERALTEECRGQQGTCTSVVASEPSCRELVIAVPSPAAEKDKKPDSKKK
jgi:hypothetical protein